MLHLDLKYQQVVKKILNKNIPDRQVIVFGSRITEHYKPHSDLDLCILGDTPLTLKELASLREDFSESDLPIRVDIVDWAAITPEFRAVINAQFLAI